MKLVDSNRPIRVGIAGLGARTGWAAHTHLPALRSLPDFELHAVTASTPEASRASAQAHGVPHACGTYQELVERDDLDLVVVSVKVPMHGELVSAALEAGKSVLCEWPLGNGLAEAEQFVELAAANEGQAFCGLQARYVPAVRYIRHLVLAEEIGDVLSSSIVAAGMRWGETVDHSQRYLLDSQFGATMTTIPFGHCVDAVIYALGDLHQVSAISTTKRKASRDLESGEMVPMNTADQLAMAALINGDTIISVHYRGGISLGTNFQWEINGSDGAIFLTGESGHLQFGLVRLEVSDADGKRRTCEIPPDFVPVPAHDLARELSLITPQSARYDLRSAMPIAGLYADVAQDLRRGTSLAPTFAEAVGRHRVVDAVERSAATGVREVLVR